MSKTFKIKSGKIVLSDPCYELGTWCQGVVDNVKNGVWSASVNYENNRVSVLNIYNIEEAIKQPNIINATEIGAELPYICGVDSGQFGFFDYDDYLNNNLIKEHDLECEDFGTNRDDDLFYRACCYLTLGEEKWGTLPTGVVSSSGYGDGTYICYGVVNDNKEYVGFSVVFMETFDFMDDYDEVDDDDEYIEDNDE